MADDVRLNALLRPLGVPLPKVLGEGLDQPLPWVILERLSGADLGDVIDGLSDEQLRSVAEGVAQAQAAVARLGPAERYGYAAPPMAAPNAAWSAVLEANLSRSRDRILAAGLFGIEPVDAVAALIAQRHGELNAMAAVPFLHDTTTCNVIVTQAGLLSGIVDVDDLCFGDARYTSALTLAALSTSGRPATYVEVWMRAAAHQDDRAFRLYVALFLVDFMGEHGQRFNGNERPSTFLTRERLLETFWQAHERARD